MPHRSNGKYTSPVTEPRFSSLSKKAPASSWGSQLEKGVYDVHEQVVQSARHFIKERPGTSLTLALVIGGALGWLMKRRA